MESKNESPKRDDHPIDKVKPAEQRQLDQEGGAAAHNEETGYGDNSPKSPTERANQPDKPQPKRS